MRRALWLVYPGNFNVGVDLWGGGAPIGSFAPACADVSQSAGFLVRTVSGSGEDVEYDRKEDGLG